MDGATNLGTLTVSQTEAKICCYGTSNVLDNRLGAQSQPIANGTDVIICIIVMCGKVGCSNIGPSNVMSMWINMEDVFEKT